MNQTDKIKEYLTQRKEPIHINAICEALNIKKGSAQAVLSIGIKNGIFSKPSSNTYTVADCIKKQEVVNNDNTTE